eukprot:125991-Pleurochrysis_carterae.AAC.1
MTAGSVVPNMYQSYIASGGGAARLGGAPRERGDARVGALHCTGTAAVGRGGRRPYRHCRVGRSGLQSSEHLRTIYVNGNFL